MRGKLSKPSGIIVSEVRTLRTLNFFLSSCGFWTHVSGSLCIRARLWRDGIQVLEEEEKRKSSLHVIRETTQIDVIEASHFVKSLEESAEKDYFHVFQSVEKEFDMAAK